jgi:PmbA protein
MTRIPTDVIDDRVVAEALARMLVDAAIRAGASAADATVGLSASLSASARDGGIEELSRSQSRAAAVRVIVDGRLGFATSSDAPHGNDEIDELAATAVGLARLSGESPHNIILPSAVCSPAQLRADADALLLWDDACAALDPAWATTQALEMDRVVRGVVGIAGVRDVSASLRRGVFVLATSTGFVGSTRGTTASLSCSALVKDGASGKLQSESWWEASRSLAGLPEPATVALTAAQRALSRRGARSIPSASLPVILDPTMSRAFFAGILGALAGSAVARRQSFLADALGEVVMPEGLTLVDDPLLVGGFSSRVFDGEGQASQRLTLIDDAGRLGSFLLDGRSAARLGRRTTASAGRGATGLPHPSPTNTTLGGGSGTLGSIIAETRRGLLVTRLLGRGADPTTGELSRGASGFFIDDGAIAFPVEGVTIAGNARALLRGIDRVGADIDERSSLRVPSLRFADVAIGGSHAP